MQAPRTADLWRQNATPHHTCHEGREKLRIQSCTQGCQAALLRSTPRVPKRPTPRTQRPARM
eukprot:10427472-Alexandrium_andersonii.AAC.1